MSANLPSGYQMLELPRYGKEGTEIFNLLKGQLPQLQQMAQGKGDIYSQLEGPARRQLMEQILPQIGAQFGLSGSQKSSGFQQAISGAGRGFAEDLYSQRAQLQQQSLDRLLGLGQSLLGQTPTQMNLAHQQKPKFDMQSLLGAGGEALSGILQDIIGKPQHEGGIDWGNVTGTAAKFLPLLLGLL